MSLVKRGGWGEGRGEEGRGESILSIFLTSLHCYALHTRDMHSHCKHHPRYREIYRSIKVEQLDDKSAATRAAGKWVAGKNCVTVFAVVLKRADALSACSVLRECPIFEFYRYVRRSACAARIQLRGAGNPMRKLELLLDSGTISDSFRRRDGDLGVPNESTISALRWKYVFPRPPPKYDFPRKHVSPRYSSSK